MATHPATLPYTRLALLPAHGWRLCPTLLTFSLSVAAQLECCWRRSYLAGGGFALETIFYILAGIAVFGGILTTLIRPSQPELSPRALR